MSHCKKYLLTFLLIMTYSFFIGLAVASESEVESSVVLKTKNRNELFKQFQIPPFTFNKDKIRDKTLEESKEIITSEVVSYVLKSAEVYDELLNLDHFSSHYEFHAWIQVQSRLKLITTLESLLEVDIESEVTVNTKEFFRGITKYYVNKKFKSQKDLSDEVLNLKSEIEKLTSEVSSIRSTNSAQPSFFKTNMPLIAFALGVVNFLIIGFQSRNQKKH